MRKCLCSVHLFHLPLLGTASVKAQPLGLEQSVLVSARLHCHLRAHLKQDSSSKGTQHATDA